MDRFNLNKYRQQSRTNPQSSTTPVDASRGGSSVPQPVASSSKLPPLQNGQSVPLAPFQQHPLGINRAEPPQTRASASYHGPTLSHHQQFNGSYSVPSTQTQKASTSESALQQQEVRVFKKNTNKYI
jgi:hypothetical protein